MIPGNRAQLLALFKTQSGATQPPGAVIGLTFSAVGATAFTLGWSAPITGGPATSYLVSYRVTGSGAFPAAVSTSNLFFIFTGLSSLTSYDVQIIATNATGNGPPAVGTQTTASTDTFGSLGFVGGNVNPSVNYQQAAIFNNAIFDGSPFKDPAGGPGAPGFVDANGWPTSAWTLTLTAVIGGAVNTVNQPHLQNGQLTGTTYTNCLFKTPSATPCVISYSGGSISALTLQSDDGTTKTYTFTLNNTLNTNGSISGTHGISFMWIPHDGSSAYPNAQPPFNSTALAYYGQLNSMRLMDFVSTLGSKGCLGGAGRITETSWSGATSGRVPDTTMKFAYGTYSWETIFAWCNAVYAQSGNVTRPWINLPLNPDTGYCTNLATLANSLAVPPMDIEVYNECWNPAYPALQHYQYLGVAEAQVVATYGQGAFVTGLPVNNAAAYITSMTSDASQNITVTLSVPLSSLTNLPADASLSVGTMITAFPVAASGANWNAQNAVISATTSNSFTYPSHTATASSSLTELQAYELFFPQQQNIASITSDASGNITVTLSVPLSTYPFITAGQAMVASNATQLQGNGWSVGTLASPVTVASVNVGANSFTFPNANASAPLSSTLATTASFSCWFGQVASSGVGLDSDLVKGAGSWNVSSLTYDYHTRLVKRCRDAWFTVRTQDRFMLGMQTYGAVNGTVGFPSPQYVFGNYLGNLPGSTTPGCSWFYGGCVAPYNQIPGATLGTLSVSASTGSVTASLSLPLLDGASTDTGKVLAIINAQGTVLGQMTITAPIDPQHCTATITSGTLSGSPYSLWSSTPALPGMVTAVYASFASNLAGSLGTIIDAHVFWSRFYGVVPVAYEWGPDTSKIFTLQIELSSDARQGPMVTALGNRMLQAGFQETNYFITTPTSWIEAGDPWSSQQTLTDTFTNSKTLALIGLQSQSVTYANGNGTCPCTFPVASLRNATAANKNVSNANAPLGMLYWGSSGTRDAYYLGASNLAKTYTFRVPCTDSTAGTIGSVFIDGALQGTFTVPQSGSGSSSTSTPSYSTTVSATVPRGPFILRVAFTSNGTAPGITVPELN